MQKRLSQNEIESQEEVLLAAKVLAEIEKHGLEQACIASGWTRGWLTNIERSDIDIAYVGSVHYLDAQKILKETVKKYDAGGLDWDLEGIWNAQIACPEITTTKQHYLTHYVCSIDSVYLASDGKLHDATGFGMKDAVDRTLRMNDYEEIDFNYKPVNIVYLCLEGCRRVAKFDWTPTSHSIDLIRKGLPLWDKLESKDKEYFYNKKIIKKFPADQWESLKVIYEQFGWGFIFEESKPFLVNSL